LPLAETGGRIVCTTAWCLVHLSVSADGVGTVHSLRVPRGLALQWAILSKEWGEASMTMAPWEDPNSPATASLQIAMLTMAAQQKAGFHCYMQGGCANGTTFLAVCNGHAAGDKSYELNMEGLIEGNENYLENGRVQFVNPECVARPQAAQPGGWEPARRRQLRRGGAAQGHPLPRPRV